MHFDTHQKMHTGQQLQLAPRIIQTMEIMQLPLPALEEKIAQELESNIALELEEPEQEDDIVQEIEEPNEFENDDDYADMPRQASSIDGRDPKLDAMSNIRARQESLSEQLLHQWGLADVDATTLNIGIILIGMIDTDGFLTCSMQELSEQVIKDTNNESSTDQIEKTILSLQKWLDPPGIAARSLQESLLIQVHAFAADDPESWNDVEVLIENHLDDLIANRLPKIATGSGIGLNRVKIAIERMHELTLSPGRLLATDRVLPVIPDAFIEYDDSKNKYVVGVSNGSLPPLRLSPTYINVANDANSDEATKQFIHRNINAARWIIEAVGQRRTTLGNIVQIVAQRQCDFLDQGDAFLRPLPMVEVSDILGIHVATVSRAVADKWVQTPRGIFPLRRFFSGGTGSNTDGDMSWEAVKTRLQNIIDGEDKNKPLSDDALAKKLREQGIEIARRTVVKYRQQLGIAAARLRREF
ncbi:MAG: RNA polymerase factor sigma-54 [Planctomycetes bacterium]|nr:RNA polymerase factor sigma-54 [Planctomycetota bacterium]